jgi:signal transduction histidine kinase/GAF domain-containing protein
MRDYLAFTHSHLAILKDDAYHEGVALAADCLEQLRKLNNPKRFPPRLLILLTSPQYPEPKKAEQLLAGIHETFAQSGHKEVPLIGCDVAAVFCDQAVYPKGALLICLASQLIKARVAAGEHARQDPKAAVESLLGELDLNPVGQVDPNPLANRLLLTFLPGFKVKEGEEFYPAPELHRLLRKGVQARIGLVGGVCSVGDVQRAKDGWLYAGRHAYKDAVVAANLNSGIPIGVGLGYGFESTGKVLQVTDVADDRRTVLAFNECSPAELFEQEGRGFLLVKLSTDGEPTIDLPQLNEDGKSLQLLRRVQPQDYFQVAKPDAKKILEKFRTSFTQAQERILIKKPIASLTLVGRSWYNCFRPFFDFSEVLDFIKQKDVVCVGALFDGELGVDNTGRSMFINGASSCLIFGDEMRERAPLYQGVAALAKYGSLLNDSDKVIEGALKIVVKTGFPGAMLSLILPNRGGEYIIAQKAKGKRLEKIVEMTRRPMAGNDILAIVARKKMPRFIADSRQHPNCDQEAVAAGQIISQYILPLKRLNGTVFGILQVDLGDLSHQTEAEFVKTEKAKILKSLAEIFEAGLNRIINNKENELILQLDQALTRSLSAASVEEGLQQFIEAAGKAFDVEMAHIRLASTEGAPAASSEEQVLTLMAGVGPCYEAGKKLRREVSTSADSLIYNAFRDDKVTIVNDVSRDDDYHALCGTVVGHAELTAALEQMKSYAAVAFKNEKGEKLGALSLAINKPWFFTDFLERTIEALAQRVALLIERLRAKNRLEFLFNVSTKLAEIDLDEMPEELNDALGRFSKAIKAEVASLYLWDEAREKFILRAQHGWQNPEWVNAANYTMEDDWIGVRALKAEPLYIVDLNEYYKTHQDRPGGRYAQYMFGQPLSDAYTVEAIGLPLKIGRTQKRFGILTVYRHIEPGEASGFLSTDTKLLEAGAYKISGLVNALVEHRNDVWRHQEQTRHQAVYEAINPYEVQDGFEAKTCQQILETYGAVEAIFYKADEPDATTISWVVSYRHSPATESFEEMAEVEPDKLVKEAVANALKEEKEEKVAIQRQQLKAEERHNPQAIATEGLVERVCIPLMSAQKFVGVLDLRWQITHQQAGLLEGRQGFTKLRQIGLMIGSVYRRHQLAKEAEQSKLAVQATGAYVFQRAHRLINAIQTLYRLAQAIKEAKTADKQEAKVEELMAKAKEYVETINWTIDLGERVQNPAREKLLVYDLVKKSVNDTDSAKCSNTKIDLAIANDVAVLGAPKLLKEIFDNLINNAFDAMESARHPILKINAALCNDKKNVEIVFEDNGVGMTKEEIKNAERGFVANDSQSRFVTNDSHKGIGVLLSRVMAMVQGGSLRYESDKGRGTKAIVTLPVG